MSRNDSSYLISAYRRPFIMMIANDGTIPTWSNRQTTVNMLFVSILKQVRVLHSWLTMRHLILWALITAFKCSPKPPADSMLHITSKCYMYPGSLADSPANLPGSPWYQHGVSAYMSFFQNEEFCSSC